MTDILLILLLGINACLILWGLSKSSRVYQFPFLAGCTFALWAWPQFHGLHVSGSVPDEMLDKALIMSILCCGMCYFGYAAGRRPIRKLNWSFNYNRLSHAALVLTMVGLAFQYKISTIPEDVKGTQWSGTTVVYLFFADLLVFGFAIAVFLLVRRFSLIALSAAALGALGYLDWIVFVGKRAYGIQFALVIGTMLWFIRKKLPSRPIILGGILAGTLLSYNVAEYRSAMSGGSVFSGGAGAKVSQLNKMSATDSLKSTATEGGTEMKNAVYYISATEALGAYDFGFFHWYVLTFKYFPAQIFGMAAKENLMTLGGLLQIGANAERYYGYERSTGSTTGGITDAFASFWYFGCLEFFVIGYFMSRLYRSATSGYTVWRLATAVMTVYSLETITHCTTWALAPWAQGVVFLGPALLYARSRPGEARQESIPAVAAPDAAGAFMEPNSPGWGRGSGPRPATWAALAKQHQPKAGRKFFTPRLLRRLPNRPRPAGRRQRSGS